MAKKKRQEREQALERRLPLAQVDKEEMFAALIRREDLFSLAQRRLTPDQVSFQRDSWLAAVWTETYKYYEKFGHLPAEADLVTALARRQEEDPLLLTEEDVQELNQYLADVYSRDPLDFHLPPTQERLRLFLEDCLAEDARTAFIDGYTPGEISSTLGRLNEQAQSLGIMDGAEIDCPFPEGWDREPVIEIRKTPLDFFNELMGGGHAVGESCGLIAPYGGGKTTTLVQLSVLSAEEFFMDWEANNRQGPLRMAYHFTWEEPANSLRIRAICCAAGIHKDSMELVLQTKNFDSFSRAGALKKYEQKVFGKQLALGEVVRGERERYAGAQRRLNQAWRIVDMTGNDARFLGRGTGLVPEVAAVLKNELQRAKQQGREIEIGLVTMDYAGAAAKRHIGFYGLRHDSVLRHLVGEWPLHAKNQIAEAFHCPAWSSHQLSAKANALNPGAMPKGTDAAEAHAFMENLDFLIVYGRPTPEANFPVGCPKHRRTGEQHEIVAHLDGGMARVYSRAGKLVYDRQTRSILTAGEYRQMGRQGAPSRRATEESDWDLPTTAQQREVRAPRTP